MLRAFSAVTGLGFACWAKEAVAARQRRAAIRMAALYSAERGAGPAKERTLNGGWNSAPQEAPDARQRLPGLAHTQAERGAQVHGPEETQHDDRPPDGVHRWQRHLRHQAHAHRRGSGGPEPGQQALGQTAVPDALREATAQERKFDPPCDSRATGETQSAEARGQMQEARQ